MLVLSRKPGESFIIADNIRITLLSIGSEKATIGIDAPREVKVMREELLETIETNKEASDMSKDRDVARVASLIKSKNTAKSG